MLSGGERCSAARSVEDQPPGQCAGRCKCARCPRRFPQCQFSRLVIRWALPCAKPFCLRAGAVHSHGLGGTGDCAAPHALRFACAAIALRLIIWADYVLRRFMGGAALPAPCLASRARERPPRLPVRRGLPFRAWGYRGFFLGLCAGLLGELPLHPGTYLSPCLPWHPTLPVCHWGSQYIR
jgi:hypothetical protein